MLYRSIFRNNRSLLMRSSANIFIYLRDHNKYINPVQSQLNLSYSHPKNLIPDVPSHTPIHFKLDPEMQEVLERQVFEEYKNKILRGMIDEVKEKEPDPLWGEDQPPKHYYSRLSKVNLMSVSHPQNKDIENQLDAYFQARFTPTLPLDVTIQNINNSDVHQLVQISLKARAEGLDDGSLWFLIEEKLGRGHKLHLLSSDQLINLKYAYDGHKKFGSPIFHQILASLLKQDCQRMNKQQLIDLFYSCRHSNPGATNLQHSVLQVMQKFYSSFTFDEKVNFLFSFNLGSKPLRFQKKVHKRRRYEFKQLANSVLFRLNFWDMELNNERVEKIIFSLAKLRLDNTKFITLPIKDYIEQNMESYCQDKNRLKNAIIYLCEVEDGEGVLSQETMGLLKEKAVARWTQFNKIQQIRMLHAWWNWGLMDESLMQLYKSVEFESDSTLLYYACQIELGNSSQREWQIIQCLAHLEILPLPYFVAYKRFYNYIKTTTEWNLTPLTDKLRNTEYYFNVMRGYDSLYSIETYRKLREFQKFTQVHLCELGNPIQNVQLCHFAFPKHQVSLDIINRKHYVPGTQVLKQTFMNKVKSLKNLGWKHLAFDEGELKATPIGNIISNIQQSFLPYVEEQKTVIDYQDFQRAEEIQQIKMMREISTWELPIINKLINQAEGKEDFELGEDDIEDTPEAKIRRLSTMSQEEQKEEEEKDKIKLKKQ